MIRKSLVVFAVGLMMVSTAHARSMNLQRGGLGFLFPDHNSFVNPGQFATAHGSALEFGYTTQSSTPAVMAANPSFVYGNGSFGLGLSAMRAGTSLTATDSFIDMGTAGLGFSAMKERMTIGATFSRIFTGTPVSDGTLGVSLTLQGARRMGAVFGLGYQRVLGLDTHSATFGFGYGFQSSNSLELNVNFSNLDDVNDFTASGFFNLGREWFYMGAGYSFAKLTEVHSGMGRLGLIFGRVDLSGTVSAPFASGGSLTYGGTLRAAF